MQLSQAQLRALRFLAVGPLTEDELRSHRIRMNTTIRALWTKGLAGRFEPGGKIAITQKGLRELLHG